MVKQSRSELREKIMTILYQIFMYESNNMNYEINDVIKEQLEIENEFVNEIVNGVLDKKDELFEIANKHLIDWSINRLGKIDQAIICIGTYELLYTSTPEIVVINEAVELAKNFSDDDVKNMINGILDKIFKDKVDHE